jgi:hypothetical protein
VKGSIARASLAESRADGNGNLEVSSMKQFMAERLKISRSGAEIGGFF